MTELPVDDFMLVQYGYVSGRSMIRCMSCGQNKTDCDPKALRCRECAETRYRTDEQLRQTFHKSIPFDVRSVLSRHQEEVRRKGKG